MSAFDEIIGYENVKNELNKTIDMITNKEKYDSFKASLPKGLLLYGEPGTGKTTMIKCFIKACNVNSVTLRKNKPNGEFVKEIQNHFDKAVQLSKQLNDIVVLFLDDMDKFAQNNHHRSNYEEYITVQSCIDQYKDENIFVVATANDINDIPDSLLRSGRFDIKIQVHNPKGKEAEKIVEYYLSKKKNIGDVNYTEIANILNGKSCADLEMVINEAAIIAAYENHAKIEMDDIIRASLKMLYESIESESIDNSPYQKQIAYHEAGHTLIQELLEPGSINLVSISKYSNETGGISSCKQSDDYFYDTDFMENRVMALLAGKAATEIVYGKIDTGASLDLQRAFTILGRIADDYCGYNFNCFEDIIDNNVLSSNSHTKEIIISFEIQRLYHKTKKILIDNRPLLDIIAKNLYDRKILTQNDIHLLLNHN